MLNSEEELAVYKAAKKFWRIRLAITGLANCDLTEREIAELENRFLEPARAELNKAEGVDDVKRMWSGRISSENESEAYALSEVLNWYRRKSAEAAQC